VGRLRLQSKVVRHLSNLATALVINPSQNAGDNAVDLRYQAVISTWKNARAAAGMMWRPAKEASAVQRPRKAASTT
jgi:hypothetical protein